MFIDIVKVIIRFRNYKYIFRNLYISVIINKNFIIKKRNLIKFIN